ncbi:MAG: UDP-N-acetylglucosamine 1-carboxyvinyltransferase, partial [Candidatus Muirbacterium halophilum]|nr:UDP-N-acetylglucosamine 1-carboxyvinyltransferase [Candidatus Muirbacterium halophilum]
FQDENIVEIDSSNLSSYKVPYEVVKKMRASFIIAGPLLSVFKKASVSLPGGCAIGARPVDIHLKSFLKLGIVNSSKSGYINLKKDNKLDKNLDKEVVIMLDFPSVGATQNIIMASVFEKRKVRIINYAKEPEIDSLINFLLCMGADIKKTENGELLIKGVEKLKDEVDFSNIPDRIEAGTFMIASMITRGDIKLVNIESEHLKNIVDKCIECGALVKVTPKTIIINSKTNLKPIKIKTLPHPGFPTDMQAQFCAMLSTVEGSSIIEESIFENRFMHVPELVRMGASIFIENNILFINGVEKFSAAPVMASDLRAGAALVLAALAACGKSEINRIYHIDRGYEDFENKIKNLGGDIERVKPFY